MLRWRNLLAIMSDKGQLFVNRNIQVKVLFRGSTASIN